MGTTAMPFTTLDTHFTAGLTFNEAKAAAGYGACCAATALLLARYWNLLEMEHAVALASEYFDQLLSMESAA